jgi:crossover junction endodeoxyribonuclease RusA
MSHVALLRLSWPARPLWQNYRTHWNAAARTRAEYRREAWALALAQSVGRLETTTPRLVFSFHPPDRRKRDLHNMPATMKAAIDGIAQAMGCDDEGFRCVWPEAWGDVVKGGCVMIEITEGDIRA